ncbi:MAG: hypothetical protein E7552_05350 [Ruminococcaceae bacterium]|nr:hypothetical protein [Oscillospiraceae bacterium]
MKLGKRMLAWLLSLALLLSVTPFSVFALSEEEALAASTLVCGEEWVLDAAKNGGRQNFVFVPEESGRYVFYSYDNDYDVMASVYDSERNQFGGDDDGGEELNFRLVVDLTAGETYYYTAEPLSHQDSGKYRVKLALEAPASGLVISEGETTSRYVYTDGYFHADFTPDGAIPENITWESSDESVASIDSMGWAQFYQIGSVRFTATSESGLTDSINVNVTDGETMHNGYSVTGTLAAGESMLYRFTVPYVQGYTLIVNGQGEKSVDILNYEGLWCEGDYGEQFSRYHCYLENDEIYYLRIENEDESDTYYSVLLTPTVEAESVSIYPQYVEGTEITWVDLDVDFEPVGAAPEWVSWETADESIAGVSDGRLFLFNAGETEVTVTSESGLTDTVTVHVNPAPELQVDKQVSASLRWKERTVFLLTVPEDGYYLFDFSSESYHVVEVDQPHLSSWYGRSGSFGWDLKKGPCYVIITNEDDVAQDDAQPFTLSVTKIPYATDMQIAYHQGAENPPLVIEEESIEAQEGETLWLATAFSPKGAAYETVEWSSSDESIATVEDWGEVNLCGAGTVVITATGTRGLTDSLTVRVAALEEITEDSPKVGSLKGRENFDDSNSVKYKFTPTVSGYYVVCETGDWDKFVSVRHESGYSWVSESGRDVKCQMEMVAGETYYITLSNEGYADADYALTVAKMPPAESMTITGGDVEGYVGEERNLAVEFGPENAFYENVTWHSSDETVASFDHESSWLIFRKAGVTTVTATSENGLTDSITVTVKEPETLESNVEVSGSLRYAEAVAYQFTPDEDAWCLITSILTDADGEGVDQSCWLENEDGYSDGSWGGWNAYPAWILEGGQTYTLYVKHVDNGKEDKLAYYRLLSVLYPLSSLETIGEDGVAEGLLSQNNSAMYTFTPETDGMSQIALTADDRHGNTYMDIYDAEGGSFDYVWQGNTIRMTHTAGETYYFIVRKQNEDDVKFRVESTPMVPAESISLYAPAIEGFVGARLDFGAEFSPKNAIPEKIEWSSSNQTVATVTAWGEVQLLAAGTAVITVTSENGLTDSVTVTVKAATALSLNRTVTGSLFADDEVAYSFTAPADGVYRFDVGGEYKHIIVRDQWGDQVGDSWVAAGAFDVHAQTGDTYYIYLENVNDYPVAYDVTVVELAPATGLVITSGDRVGYANTSFDLDVQFVPDNAVIERITWESSNESVASVTEWGEVYLLSRGATTITATSESGFTASIVVTVKDHETLQLGEMYTLNNLNGNMETVYVFTPSESGIYTFQSYGNQTDPYGTLYDADWNYLESADDNDDHSNFRLTLTLTEGETYYVCVGAYAGSRVGTYGFTAQKMQAPEWMQIHWDYTAAAVSDYYYPEIEFGPEGCAEESVVWHSSDESVATVNGWGGVNFLSGGTVAITATSESGLTDTTIFTVEAERLFVWGEEASGTLAPYTPAVYEWMVPEDGDYRVHFGGDYKNNSIRYETGGTFDNNWSQTWERSLTARAGEVFYLYVYNDSSAPADYTIAVSKLRDATSLTIDQGELLQGFESETAEISVTFGPEDAMEEDVVFTSGDESVAVVDRHGMVQFVGVGTTVITAVSTSGLRDEITVRSQAAIALSPNVTAEGTLEEYGSAVYRFTPDETGMYTVQFDSGFYKSYRITDSLGGHMTSGSGYGLLKLSTRLEAGKTYYLRIACEYEYGSYGVRVGKTVPATEMTIDQGSATSGFVSESLYLSITFGPEGALEETVKWTSDKDWIAKINPWGGIDLVGEGTATLTATSASGLTDSITVTVAQPPSLQLNTPVNGTIVGGKYPVYRFTAPKAGVYSFVMEKDWYGEISLMNKDFEYHAGEGGRENVVAQTELEAGELCYIHAYQYKTEGEYDFTLTVSEAVPATSMSITLGETWSTFPNFMQYFTVDFGPENAIREQVWWTSNIPEIAYISEDGSAEFYKPGTVIFTATSESGLTDRITVRVQSFAEAAVPLPANRVEVSTEKENTVFSFTPTESGEYLFASSEIAGYVDPMIILYNADGEELDRADDENDVQFRLLHTLTAGETYYLFLRYYNTEEQADSYLLTVGRPVELESVTIAEGDIRGSVDDEYQLTVEFGPTGALPEGYRFTSADPLVAMVDNSGRLWLRGVGTTTITVTSESGLTDTITVTVTEATTLLGDVDGSGRVDSTDARLTLQYAVQKITADALDLATADVDGSGRVDSTDARLILQYAVQKIDSFPAA